MLDPNFGHVAVTLRPTEAAVLVDPQGNRIAMIVPNEKYHRNDKLHMLIAAPRSIRIKRERINATDTVV